MSVDLRNQHILYRFDMYNMNYGKFNQYYPWIHNGFLSIQAPMVITPPMID